MAQTTDLEQATRWIYGLLAGSSIITDLVGAHPTLKMWQIYDTVAMEGYQIPFCVFTYIGGTVIRGTGSRKIFTKPTYTIKLVNTGPDISVLMPAMTWIEQTFQQDQTVTDAVSIGCSIDNYLHYVEEDQTGVRYNHVGFQISMMVYNAVTPGGT